MKKWDILADRDVLAQTAEEIKKHGIEVKIVENRAAALALLKEIIPKGADVFNGSSMTLKEIGFLDYLSEQTNWNNLHMQILMEKDQEKRKEMRRKAVTADYFLSSVNAISQNGELVACDASGSRVTALPYAAKHVVLVAGTQKICADLEEAIQRVREYVYPLENKRAKEAYGFNSSLGKWVIIEREPMPGRITLILVKEKLGF